MTSSGLLCRFGSFAAAMLLGLGLVATGHAQSPAPLPNPNLQLLTNGFVFSIARLPDGSIVFGGEFSLVNGIPRSNIAKLQADGTLDPNWDPQADNWVTALASDTIGDVYAGGRFGRIGGQNRNDIAKLSATGSGAADSTWNPNANAPVNAIAIDASGNVYAGGQFTGIGGQNRNDIAKLSGTGTGIADPTWNPSSNAVVGALAIDTLGNVYAGGSFTNIGALSRNNLAKLSSAGIVDPVWDPSISGPAGATNVNVLAIDASGNIYVGGQFTAIGGQTRKDIARLSSSGTGAADAIWDPSAGNKVNAIAIDASGNVYAGGWFASVGGLNRNCIAKLSGTGTGAADPTWNPSAGNYTGATIVNALALDANGNIYTGGSFTSIGGQPRFGFAGLSGSGTGTAGAAIDVALPGSVRAVVGQPGGGLIVGGVFQQADGQPRSNILRLLADGTLDPAWSPSILGFTGFTSVNTLAIDANSNIYVGGQFSTINGQSRNNVGKLSGSGAVDSSWNPAANGPVYALTADAGGKVYAGGSFTGIGGQSRSDIAKLAGTGNGSADPVWNPSASSGVNFSVNTLALDGNGALYAGGVFSTIGGQSRNNIAKLAAQGTGAADPTWTPSANGQVSAVALDAGGDIFAAGSFTSIGGQNRNRIAKLSGTGSVDPNWNPSADNSVNALALDSDGNVYAGGNFSTIGAQPRTNIVRLASTGAGAIDPIWNPSADNVVNALAVNTAGVCYVGGGFSTIGGTGRIGLAGLPGSLNMLFTGPAYAQFGQPVTYQIQVTNYGVATISGTVADTLPAQFVAATAIWSCSPTGGAICTASGAGNLADTATIPVGGNVLYQLTATLNTEANLSGDAVINTASATDSATGNTVSGAVDTSLVIFRNGFEVGGNGAMSVASPR